MVTWWRSSYWSSSGAVAPVPLQVRGGGGCRRHPDRFSEQIHHVNHTLPGEQNPRTGLTLSRPSKTSIPKVTGRLRCYFFLRRHLGAEYLSPLQFFVKHRRFQRSQRAHRAGKTPAELLTGFSYAHWLKILGYSRFDRD